MLRNLNLSFARGRILGTPKAGVLGSAIPTTGDNGGSYLANDLTDLPADLARDICGRITTWPTTGNLRAEETGEFTFTPAGDGAQSFQYQLVVDGVDVGSPATVTLNSGTSAQTISGALGSAAATGLLATVSMGQTVAATVGAAAADGLTASILLGSTISATTATATASGQLADVQNIAGMECGLGLAEASGAVAAIYQGRTISCGLAQAAAAGLVAQVAASVFSFERSEARTLKIKAENRSWKILT